MNTEFRRQNLESAREILSVSQLNRAVAGLLQRSLPLVWVAGEVSNCTRAASGHWYFTLKDASAQVRAVMFRGRAQYAGFQPRDGDRVEVRGTVSLYEPRGDFQLTVEAMRRAGAGDLYQRFLELKARLQQQGLFDADRKRPLPALPAAIGIVTSAQAAALRDVLSTLRQRAPQIPVFIYPTPVQGSEAPAAIAAALALAARRRECEVLLLVRGGGSIEDLWAFNDEALAHAIAASPIPVVSGVGHETDFTIADFVADQRAPTPTGAAVLVAPDRRQLLAQALALAERLSSLWRRRAEQLEQRLDTAARLLRPPSAQWRQRSLRLQALSQRLTLSAEATLRQRRLQLERAGAGLRMPRTDIAEQRLQAAELRLQRGIDASLARAGERFERAARAIELVSPQAVLDRGYAIVRDADGGIVRDSAASPAGSELAVTLARGELQVRVLGDGRGGRAAEPAPAAAPAKTRA